LGLLSIYFQASRNKLIFSKKITEALNKQIAALLKQNVSKKVQLYFDEDLQFDLLIPDADLTELNLISAKISRIFQEMLNIDNQSILMTPLMGYASVANKINAVNDLQHKTKLALESAIEKQKPLAIYDDALQKSLTDKRLIESKVLDSFANDNFTLYFQPILDLKSLKCTGAELLLRWSEKAGYSTYPSVTIEILNKVGKGELFTRWLINSACRFASELINQHHLNIYLTINLRAEDLYDIELPHLLIQAVNLWKIKPKDIILEITENGILEYNEDSDSVINQLSKLGFKFALDDFGTGFSSLTRLRRMPIDLIKIDQSFVRDINHSKEDFEIVQSIATLADSLGKEVLAEGIEDKHCLSQLKKLKIDKGQGFYFSKPMPYEQFIEWVKSH
jgi:EAL domain-containing protein (putative c-di-GMP-specific phosphodiesterase class I)